MVGAIIQQQTNLRVEEEGEEKEENWVCLFVTEKKCVELCKTKTFCFLKDLEDI